MRIAIYGGSFDPMGSHHIQVIEHLLKYVDHVWVFPCYVSYHEKKLTDACHRIKMCQLAVNVMSQDPRYAGRVLVSDFQITHRSGRTYDMIKKLQEKYPHDRFYVALGIDNAKMMHQWYHWEELIKMVPFIVVPRNGYMGGLSGDQWFIRDPHILIDENDQNNGSSSQIREMLKENQNVSEYLDKDVETYIRENNLYI
jgi:nicotinate-nucleotide adenylyltransferase